jgi:lipoyl-dependent peroxiredoxin
MDVLYTAEATSSGGREGRVRTSDGVLDLPLSMPKELGGSGRPGSTNPEELFAAGYAACFENAILRAARERKIRLSGSSVTARVGIGRAQNGRFSLQVGLVVSLSGLERVDAEALARAAHEEICPYSRATRGNIEVKVAVA